MKRGCSRIFGDISDGSPSSSPCLRDPRLRRLPSHAQSVAQSELGLRPGLFESSQNVDKIHGNGAASDTRVWWWVVTCPRKLPWDRLLCSRAPAATHKTSTIISHSTSSPTSLMPTLIKGIISHVSNPLLTLTANVGANDQPRALMQFVLLSSGFHCVGIPVFPRWSPQPPTSINSNQCQSIHPVPAFTRLSSSSVTCFGTTEQRTVPQCSRQRKRDSTDWCAGSRHRHRPATAGRAAGGGLCLLSSLVLFNLTHLPKYYMAGPTYCWCPAHWGNYGTDPSGPSLPCCGIQS